MTRPRLLAMLLFITALIAAVTGGGALAKSSTRSAVPSRAVGVSLDPGPGGPEQAFEEFLAAGSNAIEAPQPWSELEPARGQFHLADVAAIVRGVRSDPPMQVMLIPAATETTMRSVPRDLWRAPWDGRRMIERYRRLLRRISHHVSRQVRYVSIANEADVYLTTHPRELPAFLRFARAEIAVLHRLVPWAKVGVTVTFNGLVSTDPHISRTLARLGDATIATYYPLVGGFRMRPPRAPLHDIPQMIRLARGRPLVVQEAGYSSAPRLHSSAKAQATFVRNVFSAWNRFPRRSPFLGFFSLYDLPAPYCRAGTDEVTFFCSLGLHYRNGQPKAAWAAFQNGVQGSEIRGRPQHD